MDKNNRHRLRIGDQLTLHYRLASADEEIMNTFGGEPETFRIGYGDIDPRLEALLIGLSAGEHRTFELDPGAAFGNHDAGLVHNLPRADFTEGADLLPGYEAEFSLPNGQILNGIIRSIQGDHVQVDFNHPLAGLPVVFEVKILAVQAGG